MHQIRFLPGLRPDPAGGAHDAPPDSLVGWGLDTPPHAPPARRLRRLGLCDFGASTAGDPPRFSDVDTPMPEKMRLSEPTTKKIEQT